MDQAEQLSWKASGSFGVVAAGPPKSVEAGVHILEQGGNAADAAVATIFALNITDHGQCSIGGEVPLLIFDAKTREVKALSGQGGAPLSPDAIEWYMQNGIPGDGDMKMAPVPSVVDLCLTTLRRYGTMTFREVIAPSLALLDAGKEEWQVKLAITLRKLVEEEELATGSREERLQAVSDRFYGRHPERNDIAEELEAFYIRKGGFLRREDLAAHVTTVEDAVSVNYKGYTVCKCGPWTQGPYLLQALRLLESFDLKSMGRLSPDYVHVVTEAIKLAMADRDEYYGDPEFVGVPLGRLLSDPYTEMRRKLIDMDRASLEARPGDPFRMRPLKEGGVFRPGVGGTTTCVVADRWGNVVSATPSANVYLKELDAGETGVTYSNRLLSLNTTPGHPNRIQPGKRPRITLTPTLVLKEGRPILAISVAGQDLQDQVTLQLILNFVEFGILPDDSVTSARFATLHHQGSFDPQPDRTKAFKEVGSLNVNEGIDEDARAELARRGHRVKVAKGPIAHPVAIYIDPETGVQHAAGDPKTARHAGAMVMNEVDHAQHA